MLVLCCLMIAVTLFSRDSLVVAQKHNDSHGVLDQSNWYGSFDSDIIYLLFHSFLFIEIVIMIMA